MKNYLFIGGPLNGKIAKTDGNVYYDYLTSDVNSVVDIDSILNPSVKFKLYTYIKTPYTLGHPSHCFDFYALKDMNSSERDEIIADLVEQLLNIYIDINSKE